MTLWWDEYQIRDKDSLRQVVIENVEKVRNCRKPQNGYKVYQCPECGTKFHHLKDRGEVYETKKGEIRYVF
jgi:hypothetical protein